MRGLSFFFKEYTSHLFITNLLINLRNCSLKKATVSHKSRDNQHAVNLFYHFQNRIELNRMLYYHHKESMMKLKEAIMLSCIWSQKIF